MRDRTIIPILLQDLDESYRSRSWHGVNLRGSLRGVTMDERCWRPSADRHNIWEEVVHCAYWKYVVLRRLSGGTRGSFPLPGSNFFKRPVERTEAAWKRDLALLDAMHRQLTDLVRALPVGTLHRRVRGSRFTVLQTITGVARHDIYHAGQIQLLKRLLRS